MADISRRGLLGGAAMAGFSNSVVGGMSKLIRAAIQSPNYVAGLAGWTINKDGTAEFNSATFRGNLVVQGSSQQILVYTGTPAAGNLVAAISSVAGFDSFGNAYGRGMTILDPAATGGVLEFFDYVSGASASLGLPGTNQLALTFQSAFAGLSVGAGSVGKYYSELVSLTNTNLPNDTLTQLQGFTSSIQQTDYANPWNLATGTFTVPVTGDYTVSFGVLLNGWVSGSGLDIVVEKGGGIIANHDVLSRFGTGQLTFLQNFTAGDVLTFHIRQNSGAAQTVNNGNPRSFIKIRREL